MIFEYALLILTAGLFPVGCALLNAIDRRTWDQAPDDFDNAGEE